MLRRETKCGFVVSGAWVFKSWEFQAGKLGSTKQLSTEEYERLQSQQRETPVAVLFDAGTARKWWMFQDRYYSEAEGLTESEVKALLISRELKKKRQIDRAIADVRGDEFRKTSRRREPIARDVRLAVWERDGGRCVQCGSKERLEYDHIVPFARGGGNTERNIQLLCETCNRQKGTDGFANFDEAVDNRAPSVQPSDCKSIAPSNGKDAATGSLKLPPHLAGKKGAALYDGIITLFLESGQPSDTVAVPSVTSKRLYENLLRAADRSASGVLVTWPAGKKVTLRRGAQSHE